MTRDKIIRLASQAIDDTRSEVNLTIPFVMRFAALVAAAEREAIIAKLLELGALGDGAYLEALHARGNQPPRVGDCTEVKPS